MKLKKNLLISAACICVAAGVVISLNDKPVQSKAIVETRSVESGHVHGPDCSHSGKFQRMQKITSTDRTTIETENGLVYSDFKMDPFPVGKSTDYHAWSNVDGKDMKAISALAHNDLEKARLIQENQWTDSRQLVYRKETSLDLLKASKEKGEEPTSMMIPGPDGQEYAVTIKGIQYDQADLDNLKEGEVPNGGVILGTVAEIPGSEVIMAFEGGMESGSLIAPNMELNYSARENGQLTISSINSEQFNEYVQEVYSSACADCKVELEQ